MVLLILCLVEQVQWSQHDVFEEQLSHWLHNRFLLMSPSHWSMCKVGDFDTLALGWHV
jgi:hypothetical protein